MNTLQYLAKNNRKEFNKLRRELQAEIRKRPASLTEINQKEIQEKGKGPKRAWVSRDFLAQIYEENGFLRMTVSRTGVDNQGNWLGNITWDELQKVKEDIGYGNMWGLEVFPAKNSVVNVAAMRHVFLFDEKPDFAW